MRLQDKIALITGGNGGIGRSIAELAVAEGAHVVIAARNVARGEETVQALRQAGGRAIFVAADLSQEDQVRQVVERTIAEFGALHVVVNNAGAGAQKSGVQPQDGIAHRAAQGKAIHLAKDDEAQRIAVSGKRTLGIAFCQQMQRGMFDGMMLARTPHPILEKIKQFVQ